MSPFWKALLQPGQLWTLFKETFTAWSNDNVPRHGAALAYYTVLSLVPLLVVIIAMTGLIFGREAAEGYILGQIGSLIGPQSAEAIKDMIRRANEPSTGLLATSAATGTLLLGASGVFLAALLAVGREGLETALFLYPTLQAQGSGIGPALGAVLGIATAVGIGFLLYRGAVNLNLATFFKVTGAGLIVIAAGVLAYGVHDLQEAAILPGLNTLAWDINGWDITSWYGTLLKGIFNVGPQMTVLEVITYVAYLVPTMVLFLRPLPASDTGSTSSAPGEHTATAAPTLTPPTTVPAGGHS